MLKFCANDAIEIYSFSDYALILLLLWLLHVKLKIFIIYILIRLFIKGVNLLKLKIWPTISYR